MVSSRVETDGRSLGPSGRMPGGAADDGTAWDIETRKHEIRSRPAAAPTGTDPENPYRVVRNAPTSINTAPIAWVLVMGLTGDPIQPKWPIAMADRT